MSNNQGVEGSNETNKDVIKLFEKIPQEIVVKQQKVALISGITGQVSMNFQ